LNRLANLWIVQVDEGHPGLAIRCQGLSAGSG
jgi:hypothetical protein